MDRGHIFLVLVICSMEMVFLYQGHGKTMWWEFNEKISAVDCMRDEIKPGLLGQPIVTFNQYSGYVTVNAPNGRSLFYYFAEVADPSPSSKPLILWLNGGPGCSSLGVSSMTESGPFGVHKDGKSLYLRHYRWNKIANMLFLDSPAGVGFSYSNTSSDYNTTDDARTAEDSYVFLINWFKRFPHYKSTDFYIMGESYAGYYVPQLGETIMNKNRIVASSAKNPAEGDYGNGLSDYKTDERGVYDYMWSYALISNETHSWIMSNCFDLFNIQNCSGYKRKIRYESKGINVYNNFTEACLKDLSDTTHKEGGSDPCDRNYDICYLNLQEVQKTMHANTTRLPYAWGYCSSVLKGWSDRPASMFPVYKRLFGIGLRILLYSGDADVVIPVTSTRHFITKMNLTMTKPWQPWLDDSKQVGGFRVEY